ncbi:helix-turn-helix domain-containing protein [Pseudomonas oryziphila]|uniref:DNA-binding protein n=1 Tax=Pseudomonas oryziphila TaxID=2894079 RepID=A0ABM7CU82_9PSED|nr:helix-turn-helix domain-containing protein [Pseudomonas oryziphila]AZL75028.1 DNA-binding protein [Pseudomonas oryziphila]
MNTSLNTSNLAVGPDEAARLTGHARSAIYEAIAKGEIVSFKSGRRRLILTQNLVSWINKLAEKNSR